MLKEAYRTAAGLAVPTVLLTGSGCQTSPATEDLYIGSRGVYTIFEVGEEGNIRYHGRATLERPRCVLGVDPQNVYTLRRRTGGSDDVLGLGDIRIQIPEGSAVQESGKTVLGEQKWRPVPIPTRKNPLSIYDSSGRFLQAVRGSEWSISTEGDGVVLSVFSTRKEDRVLIPPEGTVRIGEETIYRNTPASRENEIRRSLHDQLRRLKWKQEMYEDVWPSQDPAGKK